MSSSSHSARLGVNSARLGVNSAMKFANTSRAPHLHPLLLLLHNLLHHNHHNPHHHHHHKTIRLFFELSPFDSSPTPITSTNENSIYENGIQTQIYLHSHVLHRSKYFSALLSDRWQTQSQTQKPLKLNLGIPPTPASLQSYITVFELLYTPDLSNSIDSVSTALDLLPIALELLFEDLVKSCVTYLESVPWTEAEEQRVLSIVPFLKQDESQELLSRLSAPTESDTSEEMLHSLVSSAINTYPNMAFVKAFVAKLLRDYSSRESAKRVLEAEFEKCIGVVKESLEDYSSPDFRGDHNETEAIQRLNLHKAMTNGKHLLWLIERMIELRVAYFAVKAWSEQASFTADLQRAFRDDAWRNIVPGLPAVVLRCTSKLANAVAAGIILATKQVRKKLVKEWLPVLIVCKDNVSPMSPSNKSLYLELEETFLRIISTLPMSDSQELLQQCLSFSTRNVDDCPHLLTAFNTWFRRAARPPQTDDLY
ncbi:BTB/POZ domain-containing protein At3g05675-like [Quercus suber]|uniref:BTB/POZ domain-containing protein At3g05675-like n=1 Tax=Quercus suber TaxID=58331 RepID=UPI0032E0158D